MYLAAVHVHAHVGKGRLLAIFLLVWSEGYDRGAQHVMYVCLCVCSYMGIGLSCAAVNLNRLPGWERNSYGYHADDGCLYCSSATGQKYGPTFTTGDVVGCGLNLVTHSIFFTKNGINIGTATSDLPVSTRGCAHVQ